MHPFIVEPSRQTSLIATADVLVCGAGPSGLCAAVAAARLGAKTYLLEKGGYPGGSITNSLVMPLMTFHATPEKRIVGGIAEELIRLVQERGGSPGHIADPLGTAATITPIDVEIFKRCALEMIAGAGIHCLLHTLATGTWKEGNTVQGVLLENKSGRSALAGKVIIDATGDADIAFRAGAAFVYGRSTDHLTQPMTLMFRMAGVDGQKVRSYISQNPDDFVLTEEAGRNILSLPYLAVSGFFRLVKQAQEDGRLETFRDRVLYFESPHPGEVAVNMTRVLEHSGTDARQFTRAHWEGHRQVVQCVSFLRDYIPGFSAAYLLETAAQIGVRETRHLVGRYTLTGEDVIGGAEFPDSIARGAFPIDIHSPDGAGLEIQQMQKGISYGIPYRCLLPLHLEGLLVTGRPISATHEANASARVTPTCMALGESAGTAAALAVRNGVPPSRLEMGPLRQQLEAQGAIC